jgi:4-hydroxy-2-oxoglutarate aldolase
MPSALKIECVFAPIPTPFAANGSLLVDALKANLARWNTAGLHGYVVLGSDGEAVLLSEARRGDEHVACY